MRGGRMAPRHPGESRDRRPPGSTFRRRGWPRIRSGTTVGALACAALAISTPAFPQPLAETAAELRSLQSDDARLQTIGWRLARANAPFCTDAAPALGLLLLDTASFREPERIRAALGLKGAVAVGAVAEGSPAAAAGLRAGDEILSIDDSPMQNLSPAAAGDPIRLQALHERLEAALVRSGSVTLRLGGPIERALAVQGEPACRSRFELEEKGRRAAAEGTRVIVGGDWLAAAHDDAEAAAIVAHELAHNILRHRARLNAQGRAPRAIRATEREADRLAPWLMVNAGYDPQAAARFAEGRLKARARRFAPTHDSWRRRLAHVRAEVAAIAGARARQPSGPLDWRGRFHRGPLKLRTSANFG